MTTDSGRDRRKDPRFSVSIKVDYSTKGIFDSNYVTNLSTGGVFIRTEKPHPIQSEVQLTFTLPDIHVVIQAKGKVVWNYDIRRGTTAIVPGMGIKFIDLPSPQRALILEYIKKLPVEKKLP
jgi:uncharacterized protein (TIGR02266 family)